MKQKSMRWWFINAMMITGAGALYAVALKYFVLPSKVILTGTEGIASALSYYFDSYPLFITVYLSFQLLLIIFAFVRVSRPLAVRSLAVIATVTIFLIFLPELRFAQPEPHNEGISHRYYIAPIG